jgi:hypothetical protein
VCTRINYKIVPLINLSKYLHYGTIGTGEYIYIYIYIYICVCVWVCVRERERLQITRVKIYKQKKTLRLGDFDSDNYLNEASRCTKFIKS